MDEPSADSAAPPLPAFASYELRNNPHVVCYALRQRLLTPADLDPSCQAHVIGLAKALIDNPALPVPEDTVPAFPTDTLWHLCAIPPLAEELATRIRKGAVTLTYWVVTSASTPHPVPPVVEAAILDRAQAGAVAQDAMRQMRSRGWFSESGAATLIKVRRTAGAKRAAITRKNAKETPTAASKARPPAHNSLLDAIMSGDVRRLRRFRLDAITPERLAPVLDTWLNAETSVLALLIEVPGLPTAALLLALEAWATSCSREKPSDPIPPSLLPHLSPNAVEHLLTAMIEGWGTDLIRPALEQREFDTQLFRVTLHDPAAATALKQGFTLQAWEHELQTVSSRMSFGSGPSTPSTTPTDQEARWIALLAATSCSHHTLLDLHTRYHTWPTARREALCGVLLKLLTASDWRYPQRPYR